MVDERPPLTKEERRQRQKRLEQARRQNSKNGAEGGRNRHAPLFVNSVDEAGQKDGH